MDNKIRGNPIADAVIADGGWVGKKVGHVPSRSKLRLKIRYTPTQQIYRRLSCVDNTGPSSDFLVSLAKRYAGLPRGPKECFHPDISILFES